MKILINGPNRVNSVGFPYPRDPLDSPESLGDMDKCHNLHCSVFHTIAFVYDLIAASSMFVFHFISEYTML